MALRRNSHEVLGSPAPPPSAANATQDVGLYNAPFSDVLLFAAKKIGRLRQRISFLT
jgi:hypothetical protein